MLRQDAAECSKGYYATPEMRCELCEADPLDDGFKVAITRT